MTQYPDENTAPWSNKGSTSWPGNLTVIKLMSESVKRVITPPCTAGTTMPVKEVCSNNTITTQPGITRPITSWAYVEDANEELCKNDQPHLASFKGERTRRWVEDSNRRRSGQDSLEDVRHVWAAAQGSIGGQSTQNGAIGRATPSAALGAPSAGSIEEPINGQHFDHLTGHFSHPLNLSSHHLRVGPPHVTTSHTKTSPMPYNALLGSNRPKSEQLTQDSMHLPLSHLPSQPDGSSAGTIQFDTNSVIHTSPLNAFPSVAMPSGSAPSSPSNLTSESDSGRELLRKRILQRNPDAQQTKPPKIKEEKLTPEEERRRTLRRHRNKEAAQRCRERRTVLSQRLFKECQDLECQNTSLKYQLRQLEKEHEQLTDILQSHISNCRIQTADVDPGTSKPETNN